MAAPGRLRHRQRVPGVDQHPDGRPSSLPEERSQDGDHQKVQKNDEDLDTVDAQAERGPGRKQKLRGRRVDGGHLPVVEAGDARVSGRRPGPGGRRREVRISAVQRHPAVPKVALQIVAEDRGGEQKRETEQTGEPDDHPAGARGPDENPPDREDVAGEHGEEQGQEGERAAGPGRDEQHGHEAALHDEAEDQQTTKGRRRDRRNVHGRAS